MSSTRGFTLVEILLVVFVAAIAATLTVAPAIRQVDRLVLRGAREELIALFHRARLEARLHGGARLHLADGEDPFLETPDGRTPARLFLRDRGVVLDLLGPRSELELGFGPLGTAHFASATLRLQKRDAALPLTISGYGRVRR